MSKRVILTLVITAALSMFVFFFILYSFEIKIDIGKKSDKNVIEAQSLIDVQEDFELKSYEKEGVELYDKSVKSVVNITSVALRYTIFYEIVPSSGIGSGSIISNEGHILTNYHVIKEVYESKKGGSITITLYNQTKYDAYIIGIDPSTDLAVLKIKSDETFQPIEIAKSTNIKVGQHVYAIGNPFGLSGTLTQGIISSLGRSITAEDSTLIEDVIQTDAAINPGNSGGPLLDSHGRMIGVNTSIFTQSNGNIGIGFAISSNTVIKVVRDILEFGLVKRPDLGIKDYYLLSQLPTAVKKHLNFPDEGIVIITISEESPSYKAGLRHYKEIKPLRLGWNNYEIPVGGDIILEIGGEKINTYSDIKSIIKYKEFDENIELKILRNGKIQTIKVDLFEW